MADWADDLAVTIASDLRAVPTLGALDLVAARIRLVRTEGERAGIVQAEKALAPILRPAEQKL